MIFIFIVLHMLLGLASAEKSIFTPQTIDANLTIGYGIALGDVDGDGKPDILAADKNQFVWYRNGDWKKFVMIENLTVHDNVCIAAEDLDGDGKVEVAVGAQWNPNETTDGTKSGSVHFLIRPEDPAKIWKAIKLYHEPTIHRMRWIKSPEGNSYLVVLPLHGKGNNGGQGKGVNMLIFQYPDLLKNTDTAFIIPTNMHLTHNMEIMALGNSAKKRIYIAGKEGIGFVDGSINASTVIVQSKIADNPGAGEIRSARPGAGKSFLATIEPMHGNTVVIYTDGEEKRQILDSTLNEGHGLVAADLLGLGHDQIIAGWRKPDKDGKTGIKLYSRRTASSTAWKQQWIDENSMACEDLQVSDLNGDGRLDIVASGRATRNLKIYWNIGRTKK